MKPVPLAPAGGSRSSSPAAGPADVRPSGPAGTRPSSRTDASRPSPAQRLATLAGGFATLYLEVEAGRRPRRHLAPLMTPMLYARLSDVWVRGGNPGAVLQVRVADTSAGRCNVIVVVRRGRRHGVISMAMTRTRRGWLVDEVAVPEHGPLPLPAYPVPADEDGHDDEVPPVALAQPLQTPGSPAADWFASSPTG